MFRRDHAVCRFSILNFFFFVALVCAAPDDPLPPRLKAASEAEKAGRLDESVRDYRAVLLENADEVRAYQGIARVRMRQKKWDYALRNWRRALSIHPADAASQLGLAEALDASGHRERALNQWRRVFETSSDPKIKKKAEKRIQVLSGRNKSDAIADPANPTGSEAASKYDYQLPAFLAGKKLYHAGKCSEALQKIRDALRQEPGHPGAYYFGGVCRFNQGQFDKADYNFRKSFAYPEFGFNAHYYLGRIAEKSGKLSAAKKQYTRYLKLTTSEKGRKEVGERLARLKNVPDHSTTSKSVGDTTKNSKKSSPNPAELHSIDSLTLFAIHEPDGPGGKQLKKAWNSYSAGKVNRAITELKEVTLYFPRTPNSLAAQHDIAALYLMLGLAENARNVCSSLLRTEAIEPYRSAVNFLLARSLKDLDEPGRALSALKKVLWGRKLGPSEKQYQALRGVLKLAMQDTSATLTSLKKAIASEKDERARKALQLEQAELYLKSSRKSEALKVLRSIVKGCEKIGYEVCRKAGYEIADQSYRSSRWEQARKDYEAVLKNFPDSVDAPWALYQLGNVYRSLKRYEESVKMYSRLVEEFSSSYWAEQARWKRDDTIWLRQYEEVLDKQ